MAKHEVKSCPRCEKPFECKVNNITQCQCYGLQISEATQEYLQQTQYDCLCAKCLQELDNIVKTASETPLPRRYGEFQEGLHYYVENGLLVYTEFYHIQRGYCCGSGCRHCAYGFGN